MNPDTFVDEFLERIHSTDGVAFLTENSSALDDSFATVAVAELKSRADELQRSNTTECQKVVAAMNTFADYTKNDLHAASAYFAQGNMEIFALGSFSTGLESLAKANTIFESAAKEVEQAKLTMSQMVAFACLGRYQEAITVAEWGRTVFQDRQDSHRYALLSMNLANVYEDLGELAKTEMLFEQAENAFQSMADDSDVGQAGYHLGWIDGNRAILFRTLGRFSESIQSAEKAQDQFAQANQKSEVQRVRENLAVTYAMMGRTNEAIQLLNEVREYYTDDGRPHDALLVELSLCDILLRIHRYEDVGSRATTIRKNASQVNNHREIARSLLVEGRAYHGLGKHQEASQALDEAAQIFAEQENYFALARVDLEQALVQLALDEPILARSAALAALDRFQNAGATYDMALATWVSAKALLAGSTQSSPLSADDATQLQSYIALLNDTGTAINIPLLNALGMELQGDWLSQSARNEDALAAYGAAVEALEQLSGNLMVEHRIDFAAANRRLYEKAVRSALALQDLEVALDYTEQAKSRSLLELMAYQIELRLDAKDEADAELIEELKALQARRNQIYRELEGSEQLRFTNACLEAHSWEDMQALTEYENRITELWEKLLIRNADYAKAAALNGHWTPHSIPPLIPANTLVLEYFTIGSQIIVFLIDQQGVRVHYLSVDLTQISELLTFFDLNCTNVVPHQNDPTMSQHLLEQAQEILAELFDAVMGPFEHELAQYQRIMIVPHQALHHLPFHALYNGQAYLIERFALYYLPNASLMQFCEPKASGVGSDLSNSIRSGTATCASFGYANNDRLPFSISEALDVAELMGGTAYVDGDATCEQLREVASEVAVLHISTHGEFHANNPLFSGLTLADGSLTTLDLFELELNASLVVLSACQTGRNVVSGGDELLGLLRGFLYAGASSLLLTHWPVEDRSTAEFMNRFYRNLLQQEQSSSSGAENCGCGDSHSESIHKVDALRRTQKQFIHSNPLSHAQPDYRHPYWWASFFLVGHPGALLAVR